MNEKEFKDIYLGTFVIVGLEFLKLISFSKEDEYYLVTYLTLKQGESAMITIWEPQFIPLINRLSPEEYEKLEGWWNKEYQEYTGEEE
jgi:hypothetical protein